MFDLDSLATWDRALADLPAAPARASDPGGAGQPVCPETGARPAPGGAATGRCPFVHGAAAEARA